MKNNLLRISNLKVKVDGNIVLENLNLIIDISKVNVLIGPNGAGKSTLANVIMGNPKYEIIDGKIEFDGEDLTNLSVDERARKGLFMSFQNPVEVEGVSMLSFLKNSYSILKKTSISATEFNVLLEEKMSELNLPNMFKLRFLNHNFSGGEKKKSEILQLLLFEPKFAILDEIDSGLDIDSIKIVGKTLKEINERKKYGFLLITHSNKMLEYLSPDKVYVLEKGRITKEGDSKLISILDYSGFNSF